MLKNDLGKLIKIDTSNMKFNACKFELLWYGKHRKQKTSTAYISYDDSNIDSNWTSQRSRNNDEQHS